MRDGQPDGSWTLAEYWEWDEHYHMSRLRASSQRQHEGAWRLWWRELLGDVPMRNLTMQMIHEALDHNLLTKDVAPSTTRTNLGQLASVLERARLNRVIDRNPAEKIRGPRMVPTRSNALTPDELWRWLDTALLPTGLGGYLWAGPLLATAPLTGLRLGEIRGLRWPNVQLWDPPGQLTAGTIKVVEQIESATRHTEWVPPKSASSYRLVPIPGMLADVLHAQRERVERQARRLGTRRWHDYDLVFPSISGRAFTLGTIQKAREKIAELAGIDPVPTMNCLRHTYASRLVEGGMSPPQVAKLLGHADELLVIRVYYDAGPVTHESAAAAITASIPKRRSYRDT